jgi:hypothetical protein
VARQVGVERTPRLAGAERQGDRANRDDRPAAEHRVAVAARRGVQRRAFGGLDAQRVAHPCDQVEATRAAGRHLLQRHHVGVDLAQHVGDPVGIEDAVAADRVMDVQDDDGRERRDRCRRTVGEPTRDARGQRAAGGFTNGHPAGASRSRARRAARGRRCGAGTGSCFTEEPVPFAPDPYDGASR